MITTSPWHVFKCWSNQEDRAHRAIEQHGIPSVYLYQTEEVCRRLPGAHRTKREEVERPMLVRYAFAKHDKEAWLRWKVAQIEYVLEDDVYRPIKPLIYLGHVIGRSVAEFDRLRAISGSKVEVPKPRSLAVGDRAKVTDGPFQQGPNDKPLTIEVVTKNKAKITIGSIPIWVRKDQLKYVPASDMEKAA